MSEITKKSEGQKDAEADVDDFRRELGPFVVAAETTRMAMVFTDANEADHPIIFANDSFLKLTGYGREELLAKSFDFLMASDPSAESVKDVAAAFEGGSDLDPEILCRRKDGSEFWASMFLNPVRDDTGAVVQHFISFVDLTRHRQDQAHCLMLIDELNHRVKNTLATVQSIVWQALRKAAPAEIIRESIESRLIALSRSHDLLTREKWEGVGLRELVNGALKPFEAVDGRRQPFVINGDDVRLPAKTTLALGIALHELATNAMKYGALANEKGSIAIEWTTRTKVDGDRLVLCWQEKDGPLVTPPTHKGFGSQVIERGLTHELGGKVWSMRPAASFAQLRFQLPEGRWMMSELLARQRVLVVEDETIILMMIEGMLADLGCTSVTAAATIDQALALIDAEAFDVAMLDLNLGGQRTYPVADRLAARRVPFFFSTGYSEHSLKADYADRPVLNKPFQSSDLAAAFRHLLSSV
jgi:PAS domain S-box-containing protein